jgi:hypothetical protein
MEFCQCDVSNVTITLISTMPHCAPRANYVQPFAPAVPSWSLWASSIQMRAFGWDRALQQPSPVVGRGPNALAKGVDDAESLAG